MNWGLPFIYCQVKTYVSFIMTLWTYADSIEIQLHNDTLGSMKITKLCHLYFSMDIIWKLPILQVLPALHHYDKVETLNITLYMVSNQFYHTRINTFQKISDMVNCCCVARSVHSIEYVLDIFTCESVANQFLWVVFFSKKIRCDYEGVRKRDSPPKNDRSEFCHHLLTLMSFQTCKRFFLLLNTKEDILNVGNQTVSVPIDVLCI